MKTHILAGGLLLSVAASQVMAAAPFLEGQVTDEQGRPIEGGSVTIMDCVGTCFGGKTVLTDEKGHYVFEKKPFRNWPLLAVGMPGRYEVSRNQTGPKLHEADTETPRRVDFVLGTPAAATVRLDGEIPDGWTQTLKIRTGKNFEQQSSGYTGRLISGWNYWNFDLLPRNVSLHLVVVREPVVQESDDPEETEERRRENWRNQVEIVSPAIRLVHPQLYDIRAKLAEDAETGVTYITIESVVDAVGENRTEELVDRDPLFGPPADAAAQTAASELLERVAAAAAPWNALPSKSVVSYEYDFVDAAGKITHIKRDQNSPPGPAWSDISRIHGFPYMPPLRWLFSQPENVVFYGVDIGEERAILTYRLKSKRGYGAGLGVGPNWNGFFTTSFYNGTVVIDPRTATVREHRLSNGLLGKEAVETFGDYVAVGEGFAPRSLRIQSGGFDFRLSFKIHKDTLWLLDHASRGEREKPSAKVENVTVTLSSE